MVLDGLLKYLRMSERKVERLFIPTRPHFLNGWLGKAVDQTLMV
jgi:hypothetical protein